MHRLLVTLLLLLLPAAAGCAGYASLFGGTTSGSGGVAAQESQLLGVAIPSGMVYYPEHSQIQGEDGMEVLRGSASPSQCASTVGNALQSSGWILRMAYATETRALYVFERGGRLAVVNIGPLAGSTTLMTLYASSTPPASLPVPVMKQTDYGFPFGSGNKGSRNASADQGGYGVPSGQEGTGGLSTAPIDNRPYSGSTIQERDL